VSIFKSCDIRGVYGDELSEPEMADIGRGIVSILRRSQAMQRIPERRGRERRNAVRGATERRSRRSARPSILVGGDVRRSTAPLKKALIDAMVASGAEVVDIGIVPTPVFYFAFASETCRCSACAMVTASHNPPKFNGLKLCFSHDPVTPDEIDRLRVVVEQKDFVSGAGIARQVNIVPEYERWLQSAIAVPPAVKIAVDAGGGGWSEIAPRALGSLGFGVMPIFCRVDPDLSVRNPNPLPAGISELCEAVVSHGCSFGAAFDADGDRVVFVDERGRPVAGDVAGAVLSQWLLQSNAGESIVYEVNCSQALADVITAAGGKPLMEKAGHTFMKRRMITEQALFGVEISGHFFHRSLGGGDDGLYTAALMGKLLAGGRSLCALADAVPHYHATPVVRLPMISRDSQQVVENIARNAEGGRVSRLDGIRVQYSDGWALARVSVTEPVLSLRFEARTRELLPGIIDAFLGFDPRLKEQVSRQLGLKPNQ